LPDPNNTNPTVCGPVGSGNWGGVQTNRYAGGTYVNGTVTEYTLTTFQAPGNLDWMIILATLGAQNDPTNVLIRQIKITQSDASTPTFGLTPASVTKSCGTAISQTFTVNGTNVPGGSTVSYTWDFGSSSNRWYLNGNPVGQTVTTSSNTLTLTDASCDLAPSDITVTANVDGTSYNAGTVAVKMSPFTISGPTYVCTNSTSSNFSIPNLGCSPSVTWSATPSGLVSINSPTSEQTSLTYSSSGTVTLTATYSGGCGSGSISIPVQSGSPVPNGISNFVSNYGYSNSNSLGSQYAILYANHGQPGDNDVSFNYNIYDGRFNSYTWSVVSQPAQTSYQVIGDGSTLYMYVTYSGTNGSNALTMNFQATGPCGTYSQNITSTAARISGWGGYSMAISPNPANGSVRVAVVSKAGQMLDRNATPPFIYAIRIADQAGITRKSFEFVKGVSATSVPLSGIPPGIYQLSAFDGKTWITQQLIIK
jgi:hypothetical protein